MANENENLNSQNEETGEEAENDVSETPVETEDVNALKEKMNELSGKNRQLFERAKKAEGFEKVDGKWIKTQKPEPKETPAPAPQSNEPDYAKLAFLKSEGVSHPDDQKIVQEEAARLKLPLTDVLQMEHVKTKLTANKDQREALAGMPKGGGRAGGNTQQDVDFWIDQKNPDGTYKTPEDQELAEKVIAARCKKEEQGSKFSDSLYAG